MPYAFPLAGRAWVATDLMPLGVTTEASFNPALSCCPSSWLRLQGAQDSERFQTWPHGLHTTVYSRCKRGIVTPTFQGPYKDQIESIECILKHKHRGYQIGATQ